VGKILCQRDESHPDKAAKLFYSKFPRDIAELEYVILVDPMLATGGSAMLAIETLIKEGVKEERILFLNVVSCPEGLDALTKHYPKIQIVTAAVDSHLNEDKYIVPGLGDFGDRYYSTE
jgi:uracil phosphoribosyltransferase